MTEAPIERVRRLCLSWPDVTERLSHGEPTWFHRDKRSFATGADHHHDDRVAVWLAAPPGPATSWSKENPGATSCRHTSGIAAGSVSTSTWTSTGSGSRS